jgi:outer membrane phospholipase A
MSHADAANKTVQALVRVHRNEVFPAMFEQLTFDMVAEIEFDIKKEGKKFYVTSSHFWMTTDRNVDGYFEIQFDKQQEKKFGKLVDTRLAATIAKKNACFKVGYTQDTDHVNSDSNHKPILCEPSPSPHAQYAY